MLRASGLPDGKPPPAAIPMLYGAPEKVALIPAAGWLRAPLAHLPKDGGDIDSGKPLARPVYRPDVYARMVWRGAGMRGLAACGWAGFGQRRRCLNCNSAWKQMILFTLRRRPERRRPQRKPHNANDLMGSRCTRPIGLPMSRSKKHPPHGVSICRRPAGSGRWKKGSKTEKADYRFAARSFCARF